MAQEEEKHLDAEQVERVVRGRGDERTGLSESASLAEARLHLEECEACRKLVSMEAEAERILRGLRVEVHAEARVGCPSEKQIWSLAFGQLEEKTAEELLSHVSECDHCGPLLRQFMKTSKEERTPEEESTIASLGASQPEWQKSLARRLAASSREPGRETIRDLRRPRFSLRSRWAFAAAAMIICAIGAGIVWRMKQIPVEHLLAEAYTERRTLELRIPDAAYGPVRITRGSQESNVDRPTSLLEAETIISKNLLKQPGSPDWLQAKARADLLDGHPDSAIQSLQRALMAAPDSPSLLVDLATAYFERGESVGDPSDYGLSFENLGKALGKNPENPIALFNRAIVAERMALYTPAIEDWEHYLNIDSRGSWAEEARRRLAAVRELERQHDKKSSEILMKPAEVASLKLDNGGVGRIDERVEDYMVVATQRWLPLAFPAARSAMPDEMARKALSVVAAVLKERHRDSWLVDLLSASHSSQFPLAVAGLSSAMEASERGDYARARSRAAEARRLFRSAGNVSGELRARVEEIYALHLSHEGEKCLETVASSREQIDGSGYRWLQIQFHVEHAVCLTIMGDPGKSDQILLREIDSAQEAAYEEIGLRTLGLTSDIESGAGNVKVGWARASVGLSRYWSGNYPPMLGYNFYSDLDTAADVMHLPHLQVALWQEAISVLGPDPDPLLRAMAHSWMANAAFSADMPALAEREFSEASRLFDLAPQTDATRKDWMEAETWLAQLEGRRGDIEGALRRLRRIAPEMASVSNHYLAIRYYSTLANVGLRSGSYGESEKAARVAVILSEESLKNLHGENERVAWNRATADSYRTLAEWNLRRGDAEGALEIWEWYRGASLRGDRRNELTQENLSPSSLAEEPSLPSLHEVARQMLTLSSTTRIAYSQFTDGVAIWVYDDRGLHEKWTAIDRDELDELAERFRYLCASPDSDLGVLERDGRRLYDLLLLPVEAYLTTGRTLVVESEGPLARIPVGALIDHNGRYFADRGPMVSSPGLYYKEAGQDAWRVARSMEALVVGVAAFKGSQDAEVVPVFDAVREAEAVAQNFPVATVLTGREATSEMIERELGTVSVFHFAGHAFASTKGTGLALTDTDIGRPNTGLLGADEVEKLELKRMRLAVLSACATGGNARPDAVALADAFLRAGVPHVVASRWDVDSRTTVAMMQSFYSNLFEGRSVPESLQAAQMAVKVVRGTSHPFYWSVFSVFGRD